jgi:hypothetical protein
VLFRSVKDGHNIFRVLPPFGEASNGYPYRKYQIIWGLVDPATNRSRPFASSMTTEKRCPVTEFVQELKKKSETLKANMQASGSSDEEIREALKGLNETIANLSPKTVYIYNAVDNAGEVGLLELKSTAHQKMKQEMNQYVHDYNQDPTSLNSDPDDSGVWFDVVRQGSFRDTTYDVKKCQLKVKDPVTGRMNYQDDQTALPESVVENYNSLAYDLTAVYQIKSYDELKDILDANMDRLAETMEAGAPAPQKPAAPVARVSTAKTTASKITTKFVDDDDEEQDVPVVSAKAPSSSKSGPVTMNLQLTDDDDFFSQADAILNG